MNGEFFTGRASQVGSRRKFTMSASEAVLADWNKQRTTLRFFARSSLETCARDLVLVSELIASRGHCVPSSQLLLVLGRGITFGRHFYFYKSAAEGHGSAFWQKETGPSFSMWRSLRAHDLRRALKRQPLATHFSRSIRCAKTHRCARAICQTSVATRS